MASGRRSQLETSASKDAVETGEKVRVWWEPTDDKKRSDYSAAWWPAEVRDRHKNKYRVRYDNGDEEDVHMDHVSPTNLPVDFGCESVPLAEGEFCEVSNASKTDPCAWLGRIRRGVEGGAYLVEYPLHDSKPEKIKATRVRRARILEHGVWRLIKPGQTWKDGEVTSPSELELIYEDQLQNELQAGTKAQKPEPAPAPAPAKPSGSKRPREQPSSGPQTMRTGMVMDGMLSLAVTVEAVAGVQKFCFMPVPAGLPVPSNAIQVFFHQNDVPQLREAAEAPGKNDVGRPKQTLPKPRTAEDLYTDQFLKALSSTSDAPSPLTKAQALKAAANAWISVAPNVKQKYEEMADAHRRKYEDALPR